MARDANLSTRFSCLIAADQYLLHQLASTGFLVRFIPMPPSSRIEQDAETAQ
jgi:hypothetical protein